MVTSSKIKRGRAMTDQSLRESIKEIIRKDFKETVDKAVEQHGERIVEFAEQSKAIHEQSVDAIIACFKDEGWTPPAQPETKEEKRERYSDMWPEKGSNEAYNLG